jgi:hypothetical protein
MVVKNELDARKENGRYMKKTTNSLFPGLLNTLSSKIN